MFGKHENLMGLRPPNMLGKTAMDFLGERYIARLSIGGAQNIADVVEYRREGRPLIYTPNHLSNADAKVLTDAVGVINVKAAHDMVFLFGEKLERFAATRFLSGAFYTIPVWSPLLEPKTKDEQTRKKMMNLSAVRTARAAMEAGFDLVVFPEGGRSKETKALKEPVFDTAYYFRLNDDAVIVPVGIEGSENLLPVGRVVPNHAEVKVSFGKPIPTDELVERHKNQSRDTMNRDMMQDVMRAIRDCLSPQYHGIYSMEHGTTR